MNTQGKLAVAVLSLICANAIAQVSDRDIEDGAKYKCTRLDNQNQIEYHSFTHGHWAVGGTNLCAAVSRAGYSEHTLTCKLESDSASVTRNWVTPSSRGFNKYLFFYHPRHASFLLDVNIFSIYGIESEQTRYQATCEKLIPGSGTPLPGFQRNY